VTLSVNRIACINVINIQIKKKSIPTRCETFTILRAFGTTSKQQRHYDFECLCYNKIKVEHPREKKEVLQCKNGQTFGNTQNHCFKMPKCVNCSERHTSLNYPSLKKIMRKLWRKTYSKFKKMLSLYKHCTKKNLIN